MKAKLTVLILEEAAQRARELQTEVSWIFDDFTNVMEYED